MDTSHIATLFLGQHGIGTTPFPGSAANSETQIYVDHRMANGDPQHSRQLQMVEGLGGRTEICLGQNWALGIVVTDVSLAVRYGDAHSWELYAALFRVDKIIAETWTPEK